MLDDPTVSSGACVRRICAAALLLSLDAASGASGQDVLDRSPNMADWIGLPWTLHASLPTRFRDIAPGDRIDLGVTTTFMHGLGLPRHSALLLSYAVQSPTVATEPDEIEVLLRHRLLQGTPAGDVVVSGGWNAAAGSIDLEAILARQLGPLRVLGAARWFSDARGAGDDRMALAAGAVWFPLPRNAPLSVSGDVAIPLADDVDDVAWSAGVGVGIPHTALTLSLHVTNTAAATLQGRTTPTGTRYGFELTAPVPVGYIMGRYADRDVAQESVSAAPQAAPAAVVEIRRHAFGPARVIVDAGATVEWVNRDAVVHTATAEDAAWNSGAIRPGASWRARFDEPGIYPYYCGPHPYMKGVLIVR